MSLAVQVESGGFAKELRLGTYRLGVVPGAFSSAAKTSFGTLDPSFAGLAIFGVSGTELSDSTDVRVVES